MKNGIKTLAMWLIIGIILIVLISSILSNTDNKLAYSELISKIESGEVKEVELSYDGTTAIVELTNDNVPKEVNIPSVDNLMTSLDESMKAGTITVTEEDQSIFTTINTIWNINNILYILVLINGWN